LVQRLDGIYRVVLRDMRCDVDCLGLRPVFHAPSDLRMALPGRTYGTDVTLCVGERHLRDGVSLNRITNDLHAQKVMIDQRHTGRVFRDFLALAALSRGDETSLQARLRAQGGIVLMCDGVQFDERSPVLYLVWDAISGTPLFGERKVYRGEDDLVPLLQRVRAMQVPIIGVVTDKESGLVPAVKHVFPGVPYQYCQTHFLKNCAKPLQADLTALQGGVRRRADAVREIGKRIEVPTAPPPDSIRSPVAEDLAPSDSLSGPADSTATNPVRSLTEQELTREFCELVRVNSRVSGKAPLNPPELNRHDRMEKIRVAVSEARSKSVPEGAATPPWPLLNDLAEALRPDWHEAQTAGRIARHTDILREVAHEMSSAPDRENRPKTAAEAQAAFDAFLNAKQATAPRAGLGAATGAFIDDLVERASRYGDHLFACFDDPRIPATSNEIERFFGSSKQLLRNAVGCGSTTNTVIANLGAEPLMACRQLQSPEATIALHNLAPSAESFRSERARIADSETAGIERRSAVRHLDARLKKLLGKWLPLAGPGPPREAYA
jgi:hypothetical protein